MAKEKVFFEEEGLALITNSRIKIKDKTYVTANITSVSLEEVPVLAAGFVIFLVAILSLIGIITIAMSAVTFGTIIILSGVIILFFGFNNKKQYILKLKSASTEEAALTTENKEYADMLIEAINEAIVERG